MSSWLLAAAGPSQLLGAFGECCAAFPGCKWDVESQIEQLQFYQSPYGILAQLRQLNALCHCSACSFLKLNKI